MQIRKKWTQNGLANLVQNNIEQQEDQEVEVLLMVQKSGYPVEVGSLSHYLPRVSKTSKNQEVVFSLDFWTINSGGTHQRWSFQAIDDPMDDFPVLRSVLATQMWRPKGPCDQEATMWLWKTYNSKMSLCFMFFLVFVRFQQFKVFIMMEDFEKQTCFIKLGFLIRHCRPS